MKVALVYDRVNKWGGAERVLLALHEIWPQAPLYTSVYNPKSALWAKDFEVIPSFLQRLPLVSSCHEILAPLMPIAFESFDFTCKSSSAYFDPPAGGYDVVISVTSEAAKGIITKPKTLHICYCLTPTRYLWSGYDEYFCSSVFKFFSSPVVAYLRKWDQIAAQRPDCYIATCENVKRRIRKYYRRESEVVYPPVDLKKFSIFNSQFSVNFQFSKEKKERYFLVVSRLVPYKKIGTVIEAFNQLGWPLKIVGVGGEMEKLRRMASPNIEFLGQLTDEELIRYYQGCEAVVFPQEEDFGLVPLEAQACGKPIVSYRGGGALETVVEGKTGIFFYPQTVEALIKGLKGLKGLEFKARDCHKQVEKFSKEVFKEEFRKIVEKLWRKHLKNISMF